MPNDRYRKEWWLQTRFSRPHCAPQTGQEEHLGGPLPPASAPLSPPAGCTSLCTFSNLLTGFKSQLPPKQESRNGLPGSRKCLRPYTYKCLHLGPVWCHLCKLEKYTPNHDIPFMNTYVYKQLSQKEDMDKLLERDLCVYVAGWEEWINPELPA